MGGLVRDVLLCQSSLDLDIVVEGDAIGLARQIARDRDWTIRTHPRFGTAKLSMKEFGLDIAMARSETYQKPGALPVVKQGAILDDLLRRDFTINAMAARLNPGCFGELLDPYGGQGDLSKRIVRVLHQVSFIDDPTRILRALRYEQRLDFHLERNTEKLIRQDLDNLDAVTGERLWHELELILEEKHPEKAICRADELGVLQKLYPALRGDGWLREKFAQARTGGDGPLSLSGIYLALLAYRVDPEDIPVFISRLKMPGWAARIVRDVPRIRQGMSSLAALEIRPSEIYRRLEHQIPEVIKAAAVAADSLVVRERLELYLNSLRAIKPSLSGDDLQEMGVKPRGELGRILRVLRDARLDHEVTLRVEEEALVRRLLTRV
ncbi:MAG: hypothetical protein PHV74_03960 [Dehalococcoidia bacterium]|nr:hypothetical protein [Dehalococcoidia bacterium]